MHLSGIGRDSELYDVERFVCIIYALIDGETVATNDAHRTLFVKAKKALELLTPSRYALELRASRASYHAKNRDQCMFAVNRDRCSNRYYWMESGSKRT